MQAIRWCRPWRGTRRRAVSGRIGALIASTCSSTRVFADFEPKLTLRRPSVRKTHGSGRPRCVSFPGSSAAVGGDGLTRPEAQANSLKELWSILEGPGNLTYHQYFLRLMAPLIRAEMSLRCLRCWERFGEMRPGLLRSNVEFWLVWA